MNTQEIQEAIQALANMCPKGWYYEIDDMDGTMTLWEPDGAGCYRSAAEVESAAFGGPFGARMDDD